MITKKVINFEKKETFLSKKVSANSLNNSYTIGSSSDIINGEPDILWLTVCFIKDTLEIWAGGLFYSGHEITKTSELINDSGFSTHCFQYFAKGDGDTVAKWHVTIPEITEYYDGLTILFYINVAGGTGTTLQVNDLAEVPCYMNSATALTTQYAETCIIPLTYISHTKDGSPWNDGIGGFRIADYNKDTTYTALVPNYWQDSGLVDESSVDLSSSCLFARLGNRNLCGLTLTTGTGTSKKGSTQGFDLDHDSIYYSMVANAKGTYKTQAGAYTTQNIDARYLVDKTSFVLNSKTYLVFTKGEDGLFYLNKPTATTVATFGDNWWWNDAANGFPTDEASIAKAQGLYFFELGGHYSGTSNRTLGFSSDHHIFYYDPDGNVKIYNPIASKEIENKVDLLNRLDYLYLMAESETTYSDLDVVNSLGINLTGESI